MFLFSGDDIEKKIGVLSGGEKTRLVILASMLAGSNLLILDEPTYHLDRDSIEALMEAVKHYSGAVLLVTHDRDLVAKFATRILELSHGTLTSFPGDYEYYLWKKKGVEPPAVKSVPPEETAVGAAWGRDELERKLRDRESRLGRLEERFRRPGGSADAKKMKALLAQRNRLEEEIQDLREKLSEIAKDAGGP
jgi:ATP-binding cassette subfamily F protein 3